MEEVIAYRHYYLDLYAAMPGKKIESKRLWEKTCKDAYLKLQIAASLGQDFGLMPAEDQRWIATKWQKMLIAGGFTRYKIKTSNKVATFYSVASAYYKVAHTPLTALIAIA